MAPAKESAGKLLFRAEGLDLGLLAPLNSGRVDKQSLERLSRDDLVARARLVGVERPELLTRVELSDEIVRLTEPDPLAQRRARGWLGVARDLLASVVESGLNMSDAAARIRGDRAEFEARGPAPVATVTLAEIYATQGHVERALAMLEEVLTAEPDHAEALALRGRLRVVNRREARSRASKTTTVESTAPSTESAATSAESAATDEESAAIDNARSQSAAPSTESAATDEESAATSTERAATNEQSAATNEESVATNEKSAAAAPSAGRSDVATPEGSTEASRESREEHDGMLADEGADSLEFAPPSELPSWAEPIPPPESMVFESEHLPRVSSSPVATDVGVSTASQPIVLPKAEPFPLGIDESTSGEESALVPVPQPVVLPTEEPRPEPPSEPPPEPEEGPLSEPEPEPMAEPIAEPIAEPVAEPIAEPIPDELAEDGVIESGPASLQSPRLPNFAELDRPGESLEGSFATAGWEPAEVDSSSALASSDGGDVKDEVATLPTEPPARPIEMEEPEPPVSLLVVRTQAPHPVVCWDVSTLEAVATSDLEIRCVGFTPNADGASRSEDVLGLDGPRGSRVLDHVGGATRIRVAMFRRSAAAPLAIATEIGWGAAGLEVRFRPPLSQTRPLSAAERALLFDYSRGAASP